MSKKSRCPSCRKTIKDISKMDIDEQLEILQKGGCNKCKLEMLKYMGMERREELKELIELYKDEHTEEVVALGSLWHIVYTSIMD